MYNLFLIRELIITWSEILKVIILAGGLGTRLREETEYRPKPMVNVGNRPIIWHIMKNYAFYGFKDFIVCLGYKGEMIKDFFLNYETMSCDVSVRLGDQKSLKIHNNHEELDWTITLANTGEKAQTGARIKKIEKYVEDELFMVTYGDGISNIDIGKLVDFHKSHGKIGTMSGVHPSSRFGEFTIKNNQVIDFHEKPQTKEGLINGGFFVFHKSFFNYLSSDDNCTLEKEPLEELVSDGQLMVYPHDGFWQCVDTYREAGVTKSTLEFPTPPMEVMVTKMGYIYNYINSAKIIGQKIVNICQNDRLLSRQIAKFCLVGILNTIVGYGIFFISLQFVNYLLALIVSHIIGVIHSFFWNKYWVFGSNKNKIKEFLRFYSIYGIMLILNIILLFYFVSVIIITPAISQLLILPVLTLLTYTGHKYWSFKK